VTERFTRLLCRVITPPAAFRPSALVDTVIQHVNFHFSIAFDILYESELHRFQWASLHTDSWAFSQPNLQVLFEHHGSQRTFQVFSSLLPAERIPEIWASKSPIIEIAVSGGSVFQYFSTPGP
jgi:hypothetical protein